MHRAERVKNPFNVRSFLEINQTFNNAVLYKKVMLRSLVCHEFQEET